MRTNDLHSLTDGFFIHRYEVMMAFRKRLAQPFQHRLYADNGMQLQKSSQDYHIESLHVVHLSSRIHCVYTVDTDVLSRGRLTDAISIIDERTARLHLIFKFGHGRLIEDDGRVITAQDGRRDTFVADNDSHIGRSTTLLGMKTATCPYGRDAKIHGYPLHMTEIAATLEGTAYVTRQSVQTVAAIRKAKKAIRKAFENSMAGKGSNLVEIVSTCNSGWTMSPVAANKWMEENMLPYYPLGDLKDKE